MNTVLVFELVSLALVAGIIGLVCGYFIAGQLLPNVAATLFVARSGKTTKKDLDRAAGLLQSYRVIGTLLNAH